MNHSVPQWEMEAGQTSSNKPHSNGDSWSDSLSMWDYEVTELTWQNGQLAMHGLGAPRSTSKPLTKQVWERPPASGTLECIVNQGKCMPNKAPEVPELKDFPQLFSDAIVPCSVSDAPSPSWVGSQRVYQGSLDRTLASNFHTGMGSCQGPFISHGEHHNVGEQSQSKRQKLAIGLEISHSNAKLSISGSGNTAQEDTCATFDTGDTSGGAGGLTTPIGSVENTSTGKDEQDSVCHSRSKMEETENHKGKGHGRRSSISRAAAVHNQSERKRRDRINQKMKDLQKLIPNSSKTDKASVLDEAIEYLKQLQATVQLMSQTSMQQMMMPLPMQQLQMCMLAQMSMGVNAGIRLGSAGIPQNLNPCNFMPQNFPVVGAASSSGKPKEMMPGPSMPDPLSTLLTCQPQNINMDPFKMAALYQQMYQSPSSNSNGLGER